MGAPRPPPALMDDAIIEILLRLRPDDTACLARASLVCKPWQRLLADRAFLRRYREIHGAPPVLGFLYNNSYPVGPPGFRFIPTSPASPSPQSASAGRLIDSCRILDCRHGRVLLHQDWYPPSLIVWDPVTGKQKFFDAPLHPHFPVEFTAAVLCASNGCDHLDCSSGPFLVALVKKTYREHESPWRSYVEIAQASLYSSDTGEWSVSAALDHQSFTPWRTQSVLAGDAVFFLVSVGKIMKYDLVRRHLSMIRVPLELVPNKTLCHAEDGGLGVAALEGYTTLRLFSLRTNPDGVTEWVGGKVIELGSVISTRIIGDPVTTFYVVGFAEGTKYIFVSANDSIFSVELKSNRISKIGRGRTGPIFPFMRFYIPDIASAKMQLQIKQGLSDQCEMT